MSHLHHAIFVPALPSANFTAPNFVQTADFLEPLLGKMLHSSWSAGGWRSSSEVAPVTRLQIPDQYLNTRNKSCSRTFVVWTIAYLQNVCKDHACGS